MKLQLKTITGLDPELVPSSFPDPAAIAQALEENFFSAPCDPTHGLMSTTKTPSFRTKLMAMSEVMDGFFQRRKEAHDRWIIRLDAFKRYGKYTPEAFQKILDQNAAYMAKRRKEEGWECPEDEIASLAWANNRYKEQQEWKREQRMVRLAHRYHLATETSKQLVTKPDGSKRKEWVDAITYELPPLCVKLKRALPNKPTKFEYRHARGKEVDALMDPNFEGSPFTRMTSKGIIHVPARYVIKLPNGTMVDLGKTEKHGDTIHRPVLHDNSVSALRAIATRLGITIKGGDCAIINHILGSPLLKEAENEDDDGTYAYIPSYSTVWHYGGWMVIASWQKNPKVTMSSFYKGDELTKVGEPEDRLTLAELDYQLLKGAAETEVQDFDGEVVDYLNEDEELVLQGLVRDEDDAEDPVDNPLLTAVAEHLGLLLELRIGSAVWTHPELESVILYMLKETRKEHTKLLGRIRYLRWKNKAVYKTMFKGKPRPQFRNKEAFLLSQIRPMEKKMDEYSVLLKQAEADGDLEEAKAIRKERSPYMKAMALRRTQLKRFRLISRFKDNLDDLRAQCEWHTTRSWTNVQYDGFMVALENHKPECPPHQGFGSMRGMEKTTEKPDKWDESMTVYEIPEWQPRPEAMPLRELHRLRYLAASDLETGAQAFNWEISTDPCMTIQPANVIQLRQPEVTHVDQLPKSAEPSKRYSWQHGLSPRVIDKRMREARKGHAFRSVLDGTLKAQLAFSSSFEKALRA